MEFIALLEALLEEWPSFASRRGNPYPTVHGYVAKVPREKRKLYLLTNRFMRKYALFAIGDAGWRKKRYKGYKPVGGEREVLQMLRERRIAMFYINEYRTTIVSIGWGVGVCLQCLCCVCAYAMLILHLSALAALPERSVCRGRRLRRTQHGAVQLHRRRSLPQPVLRGGLRGNAQAVRRAERPPPPRAQNPLGEYGYAFINPLYFVLFI